MKKLIAMLSLGVLVSGASFAQTTPEQKEIKPRKEHRIGKKEKAHISPEERATKRTERMALKLDLNKSQKKKLQALNLKQAQEREALRTSRGGNATGIQDRSQRREQAKARHAAYEAELKDILNKKQYAQYETMRAEVRAKHEQKREFRKSRRGEKQEQRG